METWNGGTFLIAEKGLEWKTQNMLIIAGNYPIHAWFRMENVRIFLTNGLITGGAQDGNLHIDMEDGRIF